MEIVIQTKGGKSPGVVIVGERGDLIELAGRIKAWMDKSRAVAPDLSRGALEIPNTECHAVGYGGFSFKFNEDLTPLIKEAEKKHGAFGTLGCHVAFWVPLAAFVYLVYRGLTTF